MLTIQDYKDLIAQNEAETLELLKAETVDFKRLLDLNLHRQICKADLIKLQDAEIEALRFEISVLKREHLKKAA